MNYSGTVKLDDRSKRLRRETIELALANGGYHFGGSFSCVEILRALYEGALSAEDRFILSKGHSCWPWYVILREKGFNPRLTGHPSRDPHNGVLFTTGSLGHGLPLGIGVAMAKKQKGEEGIVYVLMGDGELQEGTTWESMLIAAKYNLDNLCVIVDWNNIQGSGEINNVLPLRSVWSVFESAGWNYSIVDGHDIEQLREELSKTYDSPNIIAARTVKGAGVSFMENNPAWHACWPSGWQKNKAMEELS